MGGWAAAPVGQSFSLLCYDRQLVQPGKGPIMNSVQATRLRKGMLVKLGNDLLRILELNHLTPGNKRAHIQARMRNIRSGTLTDYKFRAEEDVERATLDEREMQYLYNDGDLFYFIDTSTYEQVNTRVAPSHERFHGRHSSHLSARLDRSDRREHVQWQKRGTNPASAPRANRQTESSDLQTPHRRPLRRGSHRVAQRHAHRLAE